jgi:hypothetical protein
LSAYLIQPSRSYAWQRVSKTPGGFLLKLSELLNPTLQELWLAATRVINRVRIIAGIKCWLKTIIAYFCSLKLKYEDY